MNARCRFTWLPLLLTVARAAAAQGSQGDNLNSALDHAIREFWEAKDARQAASASETIVETNADPDLVWQRMATGLVFSPRVPKGRLNLEYQTPDKTKHRYTLVVPSTYDPSVPMPVRFYLHGRVNTEQKNSGNEWDFGRFTTPNGLAVYPSAWRGSMWWHGNQVDNILGILAELKRTYNIDENRIHVVGVSDGGTGALFLAFKVPTQFAGFLPLIGHAAALVNPRLGALGPFYVTNLRNAPLYVVNGALDPLYPVREVIPYITLYRQAGANITFRPRAESGHDLFWWPGERALVDSFIDGHPRNPFPDRISWETERTDRFNRAYWLTIDELGHAEGETVFPGFDSVLPLSREPSLGVRADPASSQGVGLLAVELGSLAGQAGLLAGDRIVEARGIPTPTVRALLDASQGLTWGDSLPLTIQRAGARKRVVVVFGPRPALEASAPVLAFPRPLPTGRVELEREGNTVNVKTNGVRRFTLLLSPRQFDLNRPIRVVTNGKLSFEGKVPKKIDTLLRWAQVDRDRTMLYLSEITLTLP